MIGIETEPCFPQSNAATKGGQTIFHPDDGVDLALVRIQCGTCGAPAYLAPESAAGEVGEGGELSVYAFRCPAPACGACSTLRVARGAASLSDLPGSAEGGSPPQTIFHPDDGVDLAEVEIACGGCGGRLGPHAKSVEELASGSWTTYAYRCGAAGCRVALTVTVPHREAPAGAGE